MEPLEFLEVSSLYLEPLDLNSLYWLWKIYVQYAWDIHKAGIS